MVEVTGYAAHGSLSHQLKPMRFERNEPRPTDVLIEVLYCGVCHSDIHQVRNEWKNTLYPCVPGHEVVGRVIGKGVAVTKFAVGDIVGVGCMMDSCRICPACLKGEENYCEGPNSWLATYNGPQVPTAKAPTHENMYGCDNTFGGYSTALVIPEPFVLRIPKGLSPKSAAPVLCAGVTTYSALKHWGVKTGDAVGIVGLGGLGHLAVKLAIAMGAQVTVFTTSTDKEVPARALGAKRVVLQEDTSAHRRLRSSFDFILSTAPQKHEVNPFIELLKRDRTLAVCGALEALPPINTMEMALHRRSVAGSLIGSVAETQEVLGFCALHGISPEVELIPMQKINEAFKKVENGEVLFRYVVDMASLKQDGN